MGAQARLSTGEVFNRQPRPRTARLLVNCWVSSSSLKDGAPVSDVSGGFLLFFLSAEERANQQPDAGDGVEAQPPASVKAE